MCKIITEIINCLQGSGSRVSFVFYFLMNVTVRRIYWLCILACTNTTLEHMQIARCWLRVITDHNTCFVYHNLLKLFSSGLIWPFLAGYSTLILRNSFLMTAEILHCTWSLRTSVAHYGFLFCSESFWLNMLLSKYHGQFKSINC